MALKINSVNGSITINPEDGVGDVSITLPRSSNIASQEYVTTQVTGLATQTYVTDQISNLVDAAPGALDTLNELSAALGDDANFSTTVTNSLALKANTADLATIATSGDLTDLGITASAVELNYSAGVTSSVQTQLDAKASTGKAIAMAIVFGG